MKHADFTQQKHSDFVPLLRLEFAERVYKEIQKVPRGKVTTYGLIGGKLSMSPRVVGWALHLNKSTMVPCHRVVNRDGRVAPSFGMGGAAEHRKRLEEEGVRFKDELHLDIKKYLFEF